MGFNISFWILSVSYMWVKALLGTQWIRKLSSALGPGEPSSCGLCPCPSLCGFRLGHEAQTTALHEHHPPAPGRWLFGCAGLSSRPRAECWGLQVPRHVHESVKGESLNVWGKAGVRLRVDSPVVTVHAHSAHHWRPAGPLTLLGRGLIWCVNRLWNERRGCSRHSVSWSRGHEVMRFKGHCLLSLVPGTGWAFTWEIMTYTACQSSENVNEERVHWFSWNEKRWWRVCLPA